MTAAETVMIKLAAVFLAIGVLNWLWQGGW